MMWDAYFSSDKEGMCADWGLHNYQHSMAGWNQVTHREFTEKLQEDFFGKIREIVKSKGMFVAKAYYHSLSPKNHSDEASIGKYRALLAEIEKEDPDCTTLIKLIKTSIEQLETQEKCRESSKKWLAAQKK